MYELIGWAIAIIIVAVIVLAIIGAERAEATCSWVRVSASWAWTEWQRARIERRAARAQREQGPE